MNNLNPETLQETVRDLGSLGGVPTGGVHLAVAQTVIINSLGGDFYNKECTTFGSRQDFFKEKPDASIIHLANMIWLLKSSSGFEKFIEKNDKNSFESTYYECFGATMFLRASREVELVIPSGIRGEDYDLLVKGFSGRCDLNVEVKARRAIFNSENKLRSFLSEHRNQLPQEQQGAIFCKLSLGEGMLTKPQIVDASMRFLRGTSRVSHVIYCWDDSSDSNSIVLKYFVVGKNGLVEEFFPTLELPRRLEIFEAAGLH